MEERDSKLIKAEIEWIVRVLKFQLNREVETYRFTKVDIDSIRYLLDESPITEIEAMEHDADDGE